MQKAQELVAKNQRISQTAIGEKLNTGLAHVNEIIAGLAYKKCILDGCHFSLRTKWRQQDCKNDSDHSLTMKATVMIFFYNTVRGKSVGCITTTQNWKASHFNIITPLFPEVKNPRMRLPLENTCSQCSGTTERVTLSKVQESTPRFMWKHWRGRNNK